MKTIISKYSYFILGFIILIQLILLSKLIFFPYPELFSYPYFTSHGLIPYKQIFDQHFPGFMFFPINLYTLGMTTPQMARLWQFALVVLIQLILFFVTKKLFKSNILALSTNFLYLIWQPFFEGWVLWVDSFLPLFLLPAFYFSYKAKEGRNKYDYLLAGLFFGISLIFKQVIIPLIVLVLLYYLLEKKYLKGVYWYLLGLLPLPILMIFYFFLKGAFYEFIYWTVTYNLTVFAEFGKKVPSITDLIIVTSVFGISLFGIFNLRKRNIFIWILIFTVGSILFAYARYDLVHLQPVLPFICLSSVIGIEWLLKKKSTKLIIILYILGTLFFLNNFYKSHLGNRVLFYDSDTITVAEKLSQETKPGEHVFLFGVSAHIYQMTNTLPAGNVFVFQFPWFMRVAEDRILAGIEKDEPEIILADNSVKIGGQRITDFEPKIYKYILENYEKKYTIGSVDFMKRK